MSNGFNASLGSCCVGAGCDMMVDMVKGEFQLYLEPWDPRSSGGVMSDPHGVRSEQEYMDDEMVMKTALTKSMRKAMASSSKLLVQRERKDLKTSSLAEDKHTSISEQVG